MRSTHVLSVPALVALAGIFHCTASPTLDADVEEPATGKAQQADQGLPAQRCVTIQRGGLGTMSDTQIVPATGAEPSNNFGHRPVMNTGVIGGVPRQTLINATLDSPPPMLELVSATLTLTARAMSNSNPVFAYRVLVPWSENTVTWDTFYANPTPFDATVNWGYAEVGPTGTWVSMDITEFVYLAGTGTLNYGLLLVQDGAENTNYWSSEWDQPSERPKLEICYIPDLCADVTCTAPDACHAAGTCDPSTGQCSAPAAAPDQTACNDGSSQTTNDVCTNGACVGSPSGGGYAYPLFAGGAGFACPTGALAWVSQSPRDPTNSAHAQAACEACYGAGNCYLSAEDGAGLAWGPTGPATPWCDMAYFGFEVGLTGDSGRAFAMCASSKTLGSWGK